MRIVLIIFAGIGFALFTILYGVCRFILLAAGRVLGVLSVIIAVLGIAILITGNTPGGIAFLAIAFAICPFGLPYLAALIVGWLGGTSRVLRCYMAEYKDR